MAQSIKGDYKRFNSEPYKTIAKLHRVSDTICEEKGLTILKAQKNDSKSYYNLLKAICQAVFFLFLLFSSFSGKNMI